MIAAEEELALNTTRGKLALVSTVTASAMASLDATIVNVAIPHIGDELDASVSSLQWVLTGYLLALSSLILLAGALGDRFGRRRIFLIGTVWFAAASVLCAVAPGIELLIAARFLQGIGGALLTPGSLAILQASFRPEDRARAVGAWSGFSGLAGALGPLVGGVLVDGPGWRWAFLLNLPVAVVTVVCSRAVPETRNPHAARRLDLVGAALATIALAAMTWTLTEASPRGWSDPTVYGAAILTLVASVAFVWNLLHAHDPLVPPGLFRSRVFTVVNITTFLLYGALGASFFLISYELQVAAGWSALQAGLALLPATILLAIFSSRSGALGSRIGPRLQLTVGPIVTAAGLLLLMRIGPDTTWVTDVLPGAIVFGIGVVLFVAPLTASVMASVHPDHVSVASGVNNAVARAANLAAVAWIPAVSGLSVAVGAAQVTDAFRISLVIAAVLAVASAAVAYFGLGAHVRLTRDER